MVLYTWPMRTPGESRSTMNAEMPLSVLPNTMKWWALGALVMNVLTPFSIHSLPLRTAVRRASRRRPSPHPALSARTSRSTRRSPSSASTSCAALRCRTSRCPTQPMPVCTLIYVDRPQGPRPSISCTSAFCVTDRPRPPYSVGNAQAEQAELLGSARSPRRGSHASLRSRASASSLALLRNRELSSVAACLLR